MAKFTPQGLDTFIQHLDPAAETAPVTITQISNANPAVVTVGPDFINRFENGDVVTIAGAVEGFDVANGAKTIGTVDPVLGTFTLTGVDTSTELAASAVDGMTAAPQAGSSPPVNIVSISNENPAVMVVASGDITWFANGELVLIDGTDTSLDGKAFIAESVGSPANSVALRGADLAMNTTTVDKGTATALKAEDFYKFCLNSYEYAVEAADAIDVSTFCDAESLAGTPTPGTISIGGWVDYKIAAYNEWREAVKDGRRRVWWVKIPEKGGGGDIISVITPSGYTETFTMNEGAAFTAEAVVNEEPLYLV
jgi:hypothetical protein